MTELFSLIVPVYNVEKFLPRCLDSVLKQTYQNYEIILIDDGSTDLSGDICDSYAQKYAFCKVIHKENTGQADSRNVGIAQAKGKYLVFLDADDYIEKEMLAKVYEQMENQGYDVCSFAARRIDENEHFLYELRFDDMVKAIEFDEQSQDEFLLKSFLQYKSGWEACFHVFKREIVIKQQIKFESDVKLAEDLIFTFEYMLYTQKWIKIPDILYDYTLRQGSTSVKYGTEAIVSEIFGNVFVKLMNKLQKKDSLKYNEEKVSCYYAIMLYYYKSKLLKEISREQFKRSLYETDIIQIQKKQWKKLLLQKRNLQQILGKAEADELVEFVKYLLY